MKILFRITDLIVFFSREMNTSLQFWRKTVTLCCLDSGIHGINSTSSSGAESSPMAGRHRSPSGMYFWRTISGTHWCWQYLEIPSLSLWTAASPQMCMWSTYNSGVILPPLPSLGQGCMLIGTPQLWNVWRLWVMVWELLSPGYNTVYLSLFKKSM